MTDDTDNPFPVVSEGTIGGEMVQTVNGRALHASLGNKDHYATWFKDRLEQYGFTENVDFVGFSETSEKGGRPRQQHAVSIDMAKELAMVERNDQGKRARLYFIECERRAKAAAPDPAAMLNDPVAMRGILLSYTERVLELEAKVAESAETVEAYGRIAEAEGSTCVTDAAKVLQLRPKDLFQYLRQHGWIYRRAGTSTDLGYQSKVNSGLLEHKVTVVTRADGTEKETVQVRITAKGLTILAKLMQPAARAA